LPVLQEGIDIPLFKIGIPKLLIAPDSAVSKLFEGSIKQSGLGILWEEFLQAVVASESSTEASKIELFLRVNFDFFQ